MKKRILSLLLTLTMLMSLVPVIGTTAGASYIAPVCFIDTDGNGVYDADRDTEYTTITDAVAADIGTNESPSENTTVITLIKNVSENITVAAGQNITLDLNGCVLSAKTSDCVIYNSGTLYITNNDATKNTPHYFRDINNDGCFEACYDAEADTTGCIEVFGGCITGGTGRYISNSYYGGGAISSMDGLLYLCGGNIVGNSAEKGGAILTKSLTMSGGTVCGNKAIGNQSSSGLGGGIFGGGSSCSLSISGGTIYNNTADIQGGGIYSMTGGEFSMTGGTISQNKATSGGGLYNGGTAHISAGTISGNEADYGGGVFTSGKVTVTGGSITGNSAFEGGGMYLGVYGTAEIRNAAITNNSATENGGGIYVDEYAGGCFVEGTKITMADGSTRNIEDVSVGDYVRSFNHETGKYESNRVLIAYEAESAARYFTLHFTNGIQLSIYDCHNLFEQSANQYVTVSVKNCNDFIGRYFYNASSGTWEKLLSVTRSGDTKHYYSLYVAKTFNCIADGMLSVPDDDLHLDIYTFNSDLTVNQAALQADIAQYGLLAFEDCRIVATREQYEELGVKYINILIGKGFTTDEEIRAVYSEWYAESEKEPAVLTAKSVQNDAPYTLMENLVHYGLTGAELKIGSNTQIKDNTVGEKANNVYLCDEKYIALADTNVSNVSVGVTLESGTGAFTTSGAFADTDYFSSDDIAYEVIFDTDHLSLAAKSVQYSSGGDGSPAAQTKKGCLQDNTCVYAKFTDADTKEWYHDGVHFCVENGCMNGVTDTQFVPNGTLSRGMIVTMLWRMEGSPVVNYAMSFRDVSADFWYTEAIRWAQSAKIVDGYDEANFMPEANVNREQLATILYRYAQCKGRGFVGASMFYFNPIDRSAISSWASEPMRWCYMHGILTGDETGALRPTDSATRAQAACMVQRFCATIAE